MAQFNIARTLVALAIIILIFAIAYIVFLVGGFWFGTGTLILLLEEFIRRNIWNIPAVPPTKAVPMVLGKLINVLLNAGWYFIPLKGSPFLDIQEITGEEIAIRFVTKDVVPGDRSEVEAPVSVYIAVDPQNPVQVFVVGGLEEVAKRIEEQVDQFFRKWIVSPSKGPQTMNEARQMSDEVINEILENLLAYDVKRIHPEIPTEVIMGYFSGRPLNPQEEKWEKELDKLSPDDLKKMRDAAEERFDLIQKIRDGDQSYSLHSMGVVIRRMVVGNMEPTDETKKAVANVAAAKFFAEEQAILAKSVKEEADSYTNISKNPLEHTLLRRKITSKTTNVQSFETSPELTNVIKELGFELIKRILPDTKTKEGGG